MKVGIGNRIAVAAIAAAIALAGISSEAGAIKTTGREYNTLYAGLGAKGYDVVSYFTDGKPALGSADFTQPYGGVTWRFVSKAHRDLFAKSPAKYAPQYGGFCAYGVANGKLVDVDPENGWTIYEGKLYLNFNADVKGKFTGDPAGSVAKANHNWVKLDR